MSHPSVNARHLLGCILCIACAFAPAAAAQPMVVGWIERVRLGMEGLVISAKLDTGADHSSLHASEIRWHTRDDGDWVGFDVVNENGEKVHFERKVVRIARVRRAGGAVQKRPVIMMGVCLGSVYRLTQVNLVDRTGLNYEFLVGRSFLAEGFAVDSSRINTVEPNCDIGKPL
jgi:hypothetical protein